MARHTGIYLLAACLQVADAVPETIAHLFLIFELYSRRNCGIL